MIERIPGLCVLLAATAPLFAQVESDRGTRHPLAIDSGFVRNDNSSAAGLGVPAVVWSTVVTVPNASWLRVSYSGVTLAGSRDPGGDGSFLRLTSLHDQGTQTQHLVHVAEWQQTSAYFNGDAVLVELLARPGTGDNRLAIDGVTAGPEIGDDTICGATDDRVLSTDPRACRNQPTGCTSWLINDCNHCLLTAGHCAAGLQVIEFNVPLSTASGSIQHPPPTDQYAVDQASLQTNGGLGVGNDWTYFGVFANSNTGLFPHQANGGQAFDLLPTPPPVNGQTIRVTGYGSTSSPVSPTWYLVQKTHAAPYSVFSGTTVQYVVDTTGGNSGSPVFLDGTNQAIGIHTHGGCTTTSGVNSGTGSNHAGLQAALANPVGVCACPTVTFDYPNGLPQIVDPSGTTVVRVAIGGPIAVVPGSVRFHVSFGGTFTAIVPTAAGNGLYDAAIPGGQCFATARFYVSAQDANSNLYTDPPTAPAAVHSASVATGLQTLRNYNFNTTPAGWFVTNTALSTGAWVRGAPVDPRGPGSDFDGSGQCWVTGNTANEDVDGGPTTLTSETFDLSGASDPHVRYALWFTNDDQDDFLVVEASQNGGASWTQIESLGPFSGWEVHGFRVRDHFTNLSQIAVRFAVADNPNNSVTEAALDAFRIEDLVCAQATWTSYGQGCQGSNGTPALSPVTLPATGTSFQLAVSGLGTGVVFMATGLSPANVALQAYGFAPGCSLLANPDALQLLIATAGTATWTMQIPVSSAFYGLHIYNQGFEIAAVSAASNGGDGVIH
ncbi:MAG: hypothetical protein U1E73_06050 [Planctomycetota bacterium]